MSCDTFKCISNADIESYDFIIQWKVNKEIFKNLKTRNGEQISPIVKTKFYNSEWYLKLVTDQEYPNHFGFLVGLEKSDITLNYRFSYRLESDGMILDWSPLCEIRTGCGEWGYREWKNKKDLMANSNWTSDFLTLAIFVKVTTMKVQNMSEIPIVSKSKLDSSIPTGDFSKLIQEGLYSDVVLIVGGKEYKAHKSVLATRCEYFASLFSSTFKEATESKVTIEDIEADDFDYILQFIYSGQHSTDSNSKTSGLLMAADRLGVTPIVLECEEYLSRNITEENCLNLFHVADLCSRGNFKTKIKDFIKNNMEKIMQTDSWKQVKEENNALLLSKIFESIYRN